MSGNTRCAKCGGSTEHGPACPFSFPQTVAIPATAASDRAYFERQKIDALQRGAAAQEKIATALAAMAESLVGIENYLAEIAEQAAERGHGVVPS